MVVSEDTKQKVMAVLEPLDIKFDEKIVETFLAGRQVDEDISPNDFVNHYLLAESIELLAEKDKTNKELLALRDTIKELLALRDTIKELLALRDKKKEPLALRDKNKELLVENKKLEKEPAFQEEELEKAKSENAMNKDWAVIDPSEAAKDFYARKEFREKQVSAELCRGGFVCHPMFIAFVKAARSMSSNPREENSGSAEEENQKIEQLAKRIEKNFPEFHPNLDQSGHYISNLMMALHAMLDAPHTLFLPHQYHLSFKWEHHTISKDNSISNPSTHTKKKTKIETTSSEKQGVKIVNKMDAFCYQVIEGTPPIASFVYEPSSVDTEIREARADMCASNVQAYFGDLIDGGNQAVRGKHCISVDVVGGERPNECKISAYALVRRPGGWPGESKHRWDKCPLYQGTGYEGMARIATGIMATLPHLEEQINEIRMGPVVGLVGNQAVKGYDCSTTCNPNIDLIREFVDDEAKLWTTSVGGKLEILEMKLLDNIWNELDKLSDPVSVTAWISILNILMKLQQKGIVHGDIRLANVLSCGKIVDFDFAGEDGKQEYQGLLELVEVGERHPEVSSWIQRGWFGTLVMKKEHDLHSMKKVMGLFQIHAPDSIHPADASTFKKVWAASMDLVGEGKVKEAIQVLGEHTETMHVVLNDSTVDLLGGKRAA